MQLKSASVLAAAVLIAGLASQAPAQQVTPGMPTTSPGAPGATGAAPQEEPKPIQGQILTQADDTRMTSDLIGASVHATDREGVGKVSDLIYKPDGGIEGIVLGVGGFLGIGDRKIAVQMADVQIREDAGRLAVHVPVTAEELSKAPAFKTKANLETEKRIEMQRQQQGGVPRQR